MEANKQITANTRLGVYVKQMDSTDKATVIAATNKYVKAKRCNGNIENAYNELIDLFNTIGNKYGFKMFEGNDDVLAMIDEFAAKVELGMNMLNGNETYTCNFKSTEEANFWLAGQNNIVVKKMSVSTSGAGHKVSKVTLEYVVSEQPLNNKYQLTELDKTRLYVRSKPEKVICKWQEKYPQYTYITNVKKDWGFRLIGGNVGYFKIISEKYIILYSFNCN